MHATPPPDELRASLDGWRRARLLRHGKALVGARLGVVAFLSAIALLPATAGSLGLDAGRALPLLAGLGIAAVASRLLLESRHGHHALFATLLLDGAVLAHLAGATGGLASPLLGAQLLLVAASVRLHPHPLAAAPAVAVLPAAAALGPGAFGAPADLFLLAWYLAADLAVILVVRHLHRAEEAGQAAALEVTALRREQARSDERHRIARELHDGVGAALSALLLQTELAGRAVAPAGGPELLALRQTADEALEELRRSLRVLREDFDPEEAASDHCATFAARTGLAVSFRARGGGVRLQPEQRLTLLRVLQEALQNVARHAAARQVAVELLLEHPTCRLTVRDDGRGFDPAVGSPGHYGLCGMRERAAGCGGALLVESAPGAGTAVELRLPTGDA